MFYQLIVSFNCLLINGYFSPSLSDTIVRPKEALNYPFNSVAFKGNNQHLQLSNLWPSQLMRLMTIDKALVNPKNVIKYPFKSEPSQFASIYNLSLGTSFKKSNLITPFGMPHKYQPHAMESINKIVAVKPNGFYTEHKLRLPKIQQSENEPKNKDNFSPQKESESLFMKMIKKPLSRGTTISIGGVPGGGTLIRFGKAELKFGRDGVVLGRAASENHPRRYRHQSSFGDQMKSSSKRIVKKPGVSINLGPEDGSENGVSISFGGARNSQNLKYKRGKDSSADESGGITIGSSGGGNFQLPAIRVGSGGITFGGGDDSDSDNRKVAESSNYPSHRHKYHHHPKNSPARPKLKIKFPHLAKTYIESNLKLPPVKLKLRVAPRVKVTTGTKDPLMEKPIVEDPNMMDIFLPPEPFPKQNITSSSEDEEEEEGEKSEEEGENKEKGEKSSDGESEKEKKDDDDDDGERRKRKRSKKMVKKSEEPATSTQPSPPPLPSFPYPYPPFIAYPPYPPPPPFSQPIPSASQRREKKRPKSRKSGMNHQAEASNQPINYHIPYSPQPFPSPYPPPPSSHPNYPYPPPPLTHHYPPPPPFFYPGYPPPVGFYPQQASLNHTTKPRQRIKPIFGSKLVKYNKATDDKPQLVLDLRPKISIESADDKPQIENYTSKKEDSFVKLVLDPVFLNKTDIDEEEEEAKKGHYDKHHHYHPKDNGRYYGHHDIKYEGSSLSTVIAKLENKPARQDEKNQKSELIKNDEKAKKLKEKGKRVINTSQKRHLDEKEGNKFKNLSNS